ncbi:hypothetical protein KSP39_PZI019297 [Platanthera zijinensis]|uniref:Uncharacterized protein n=1 Tax=Platanthera zijinensis TaxID=2320716 RepID=A0AAP0B126_9ASPA
MRREGRQHGMVQTIFNLSEDVHSKFPIQIDGPFMGVFTKAPSKPTNSSRYTSRCRKPGCGNCHRRPASKALAKIKGSRKHSTVEVSDFFLKSDCSPYNEECVLEDDSELDGDDSEVDAGEDICCSGGSGGDDCEDGGWVLVERLIL